MHLLLFTSLKVCLVAPILRRLFFSDFGELHRIASIDSFGCRGNLFNIVLRFYMLNTAQHEMPAQKRWDGSTIKFSLCKRERERKSEWLLTRHFQQFDSVLHTVSYGVRAVHEYIYHQRCRICTKIHVFKFSASSSCIFNGKHLTQLFLP